MTVIETLNSTVEFKIGGSDDDRILLYDLDGNEINYGAGSPYIALTRNVTAYGYGNTYKFLDRDDPRSSGRSGTPFLLSLSAPAFPFDVRLASINARRNGIAAAQINVIDYGGAENTLIRSLARRDTGRALRIGVLVPRTHAVFSGPSWLFLHVFEVDKWVHEGTPASSVSYVESYTLLATADVDMRDYKSVYAAAERAGYPRKPASVSNFLRRNQHFDFDVEYRCKNQSVSPQGFRTLLHSLDHVTALDLAYTSSLSVVGNNAHRVSVNYEARASQLIGAVDAYVEVVPFPSPYLDCGYSYPLLPRKNLTAAEQWIADQLDSKPFMLAEDCGYTLPSEAARAVDLLPLMNFHATFPHELHAENPLVVAAVHDYAFRRWMQCALTRLCKVDPQQVEHPDSGLPVDQEVYDELFG